MSNFDLKDYIVRKGTKTYTHQSLVNGLYDVPLSKMSDFYNFFKNNPEMCLCEKLPNRFPLYFDIDGYDEKQNGDFVNEFIETLNDYITSYFVVDEDELKPIILRNRTKQNNYHVFYKSITIDKKTIRELCKFLNRDFLGEEYTKTDKKTKKEIEIFDTNAYNSCLRMAYTMKYDRKNRELVQDSIYEPMFKEEFMGMNFEEIMTKCSVRSNMNESLTKITEHFESEITRINTQNTQSIVLGEDGEETTTKYVMTENDEYYLEQMSANNYHHLRHLMFNCLKSYRHTDYSEWVKVILIFKNLGLPRDILIEWSKQYENFDQTSVEKINMLMTDDENNYNLGFKQLLFMAIEDNYTKYRNMHLGVSRYEHVSLLFSYDKIRDSMKRGEFGFAQILLDIFKNRIVYRPATKDLYLWDNNIWKKDLYDSISIIASDILYSLLQHLSIRQRVAEENEEEYLQDFERKALNMYFQKVNTQSFITNVVNWLKKFASRFDHIYKKFDKNKDLLAVKNGNIDLKTGKLLPRLYKHYNTFHLETEYNEDMDVSGVQKLFRSMALDRQDLEEFLQLYLGYCLTGHTTEQVFTIFHGNGSNGKSFLYDCLNELLEEGKYFLTLSGNAYSANFTDGKATTPFNGIEGARLAVLDETDKNQGINEGSVKRITGSKHMKIRKLHAEEELVEKHSKFLLLTNFRPDISDDPAIHRRLINVPFEAKYVFKSDFKKNNSRHRLRIDEDTLRKTFTSESLLAYLVKGSVRWYKVGLRELMPEIVKMSTEKFIQESDSITGFIQDYCEDSATEPIKIEDFLYHLNEEMGEKFTIKQLVKELEAKEIPIITMKKKMFLPYKIDGIDM